MPQRIVVSFRGPNVVDLASGKKYLERALTLGLSWELTTRVVRLTPNGSAVVLAVPLLPGESVTTAEQRVEGGKVLVNMAPPMR